MTEKLNGTTEKINACAIRANTQRENVQDLIIAINSVENVLLTRLPKENFSDLFNAMKALIRSSSSDEDIKKALVSSRKKKIWERQMNDKL